MTQEKRKMAPLLSEAERAHWELVGSLTGHVEFWRKQEEIEY